MSSIEWLQGYFTVSTTPPTPQVKLLDGVLYAGVTLPPHAHPGSIVASVGGDEVAYELEGAVCWFAIKYRSWWKVYYTLETWEDKARRTWNGK